jgi:glycosyltransferase involved in cell wall biosynthesis
MSVTEATKPAPRPLRHLRDRALFLVWGPPRYGPRSTVFARELGIDVVFVQSTLRRGALVAPVKYLHQAIATARLLVRCRPVLVFVQSPPSVAVLAVAAYCRLTRARYVVDAHSAAMLSPYWTRPRWLVAALSRGAAVTIVTNEYFARTVRAWGGRALVVADVPTAFPSGGVYTFEAEVNVMVVSSFAEDEPLEEILAAAADLPDVALHVTGDPSRRWNGVLPELPSNVRLTGFLGDADYYTLMRASDAVMCLTTRNHTMQRGACEALSIGTPIVTSDWPLLREYFRAGTVHVDNSAAGIAAGVRELLRDRARFRDGIDQLRREQSVAWKESLERLLVAIGERPTGGSM